METVNAERIISVLKGRRFILSDEKQLQQAIADIFKAAKIPFARERRLDHKNITDFRFDCGFFAELKIKGSPKAIYKQCERYCEFPDVKSLLLITGKRMNLSKEIKGKPTFIFNLMLAWL
jgi:hypothetical protein